ncbi:hypothetical protein ACWEBX_25660 [Streptomyces sp. NPDC005070]
MRCRDQAFTPAGQVRVAGDPGAPGSRAGDHEHGDLDQGAPVTVLDSAGRVVATGSPGSGADDTFARCVAPVGPYGECRTAPPARRCPRGA